MRKLILLPVLFSISSGAALADYGYGMMGNYGMMGGTGLFLGGIIGLVYFVLACFVFSVVFWATHDWLAKKRNKR